MRKAMLGGFSLLCFLSLAGCGLFGGSSCSQSGSTLVCHALEETGVAGRPEEYFEALRHSGRPRRPEEYFLGVEDQSIVSDWLAIKVAPHAVLSPWRAAGRPSTIAVGSPVEMVVV